MKQIAFLAFSLVIFVASAYAQPYEDVPPFQDSLQITEEVTVPDDDTLSTQASLLISEEVTVPFEDVLPSQDSLQIIEEPAVPEENSPDESIPNDPSSVLQSFLQALKAGDSIMVSQLISSDGLDEIDMMLEILKENLDDNEESTMSRLVAAGYTADADEIDDWSAMDYLTNTVALPVMKARYSLYEMQINDYSSNGDNLIIPLVFRTTSGVELPYEAVLVKDGNQWKVTNFMGLNSFP